MKIRKLPMVLSRDPFINTPLTPMGRDPKTREERFWINSWNSNVGCLGVLITESGESRVYRFPKPNDGFVCCGGYSACAVDDDTVWMMTDLKAFVRLTLSTGEYEILQTGAPEFTMVSSSAMQYDPKTGRIMVIAFSGNEEGIIGVSFDVREKKTVKIHRDFSPASICYGSFPNPDGTYTFRFGRAEKALYRWDPERDTLEKKAEITEELMWQNVIRDDSGRPYIPHMGWMDNDTYAFSREALPEQEAIWFARRGDTAYGYRANELATEFFTWDIPCGKVEKLFEARDYGSCVMLEDGCILNLSMAGELCKFSSDGELIFAKMLDTDSRNMADCVICVDDKTILGTPFITQRFWLMDMETGAGFDAGRVTPGIGEVLRCWNILGKIYMASYSDGYLAEFDPKKPINYPENPRVVAKAPGMRPVASAQKGNVLYYACTHKYGTLGCVLTRYDAETGEVKHRDEMMYAQHILSLYYMRSHDLLIAGTTYISDCTATPMESDECFLLTVHPETLEILGKIKAPAGCSRASVHGAVDEHRVLISYLMKEETRLGVYDLSTGEITMFRETLESFDSCIEPTMFLETKLTHYMDIPGVFVMKTRDSVILCKADAQGIRAEKTIFTDPEIYYMFPASRGRVFAANRTTLYIAEDVLS